MSKKVGLLAKIMAFKALFAAPDTLGMTAASNGMHNRFNLAGLPPKWKGKVQARINRGGK